MIRGITVRSLRRIGLTTKRPIATTLVGTKSNCFVNPGCGSSVDTLTSNLHIWSHSEGFPRPSNKRGVIRQSSTSNISKLELEREKQLLKDTIQFTEAPIGDITMEGVRSMKFLIKKWCNRQTFPASQKAEEILERLIAEGRDGQNLDATVEAKMYNVVINSYGKSGHIDGPSKAEEVARRMWDRWDSAPVDDILRPAVPDIFTFNSLMHAWSMIKGEEAVLKAEKIMDKLESGDFPAKADAFSYNTMMNAYANQKHEFGYAQKAEDMLLHMSELQREGETGISPNTTSFNIVLKAWQNSGGGIEGAKRAESILKLMIKLYKDGHQEVQPNLISFATVINAYARHAKMTPEAADHLEGVADLLLNTETDISQTHGYVVQIFSKILEYITKGGLKDSGERASRILDKMIQAKEDGKTPDSPTIKIYTEVMRASLASGGDSKEALQMFNKIVDGEANIEPNTIMMNGVLHHHCRNGDVDAAEKLFQSMSTIAEEKGFFTRPDSATYNMMANLYFHKNVPDAAPRAFRLFEHMEKQYDAGYLTKLDIFLYSITVNILFKSNKAGMSMKAYNVLMKAIERFDSGDLKQQPDTIIFNMVLTSLTKQHTTKASERAMKLIELMEDRLEEGYSSAPPDTISYTHCLVTLARGMGSASSKDIVNIFRKMLSLHRAKDDYVELDKEVCESALFGLAHPTYGDRKEAHRILETMKKLDGINLSPNCLDLVVKAHCSSANRGEREMACFDAKRYLLHLIDQVETGKLKVLPTRNAFHYVMLSFAHSRHQKSFDNCLEIYEVMKKLSDQGKKQFTPDNQIIGIMLNTSTHSKPRKIIEKVERFVEGLDKDLDTFAYNTYITALSKAGKLEKARKTLDQAIEKGRADTTSYNAIISGCAYFNDNREDQSKALEVALTTYRELVNSHISPDQITYKALMKTCNVLSESKQEGEDRLKTVFDDACERGFVSQKVMKELRFGFPIDRREKVFGSQLLQKDDLKKEWVRNA